MLSSKFKNSTDYYEYIEQELPKLASLNQVVFTASIVERMFPIYVKFCAETSWGDVGLIRDTLDAIWNHIEGKLLSSQQINDLSKSCQKVLPEHFEDFNVITINYAIKFGIMLTNMLVNLNKPDSYYALEAYTYALEIIDSYIQSEQKEDEYPELEPTVYENWENMWNYHPLLIGEQEHQLKDLLRLKQGEVNFSLIKKIKVESIDSPLLPIRLNNKTSYSP